MSEYQNTIGGGFDYLTAGTQPSEKGVAPAQKNTLRLYDQKGDPPNIGRGEIVINDFSQQGFNHPEGDFSLHSNGFAWATLATHRPNELTPPLARNGDNPAPTGNFVGFHNAYMFDTFFVGIGSGANKSLFKQTSATNPTLSAITYSPAAEICSLTATLANGAGRLAVGHVGQPVKLMSDAAGTVASTMDVSTNSCWGIIVSGINATDAGVPVLLMYCGTSIKTKATNADMTTALVATVPPTTVNAGGFAIGALKAGGRAQRAYWAIPKLSNTVGNLKFGAELYLNDIMSTDMTGSDLLPVDFKYMPNGVLGAVPFRDGILMHDGQHVVYWDGDHEYDLGLFRRRVRVRTSADVLNTTNVLDGDERRRIRTLVVNGPECGVIWQSYDANASVTQYAYFEVYNFESGTWHNFGNHAPLGGTTAAVTLVLPGTGGAVVAPDTRVVRVFDTVSSTTSVHSWVFPRPAESLLWQNSLGSGTSTTGAPVYVVNFTDSTRSLLGCRWWLDELPPGSLPGTNTIKRAPKVITDVEFDGNLDHGGSTADWQLNVQLQGRGIDGTTTYTAYNETFTRGLTSKDYRKRNAPTKRANIRDVQLVLTASAVNSSTVYKIPQLLPITVRFAYSKDGTDITALPEDVKQ